MSPDLQTNDIVEVNDVEWEILSRYGTQTQYQIVEVLKEEYKVESIFDGIERLERLGQQGSLLSAIDGAAKRDIDSWKQKDGKPKLLVPFHFTKEKTSLDYTTNLNRYQLLTHLTQFADLETLTFSKADEEASKPQDFQKLWGYPDSRYRDRRKQCLRPPVVCNEWIRWHFTSFPNFWTEDLLYYQLPDVPIVSLYRRCSEVRRFNT